MIRWVKNTLLITIQQAYVENLVSSSLLRVHFIFFKSNYRFRYAYLSPKIIISFFVQIIRPVSLICNWNSFWQAGDIKKGKQNQRFAEGERNLNLKFFKKYCNVEKYEQFEQFNKISAITPTFTPSPTPSDKKFTSTEIRNVAG